MKEELFEKLETLEELIKSEAQEYSPIFEKIKYLLDMAGLEELSKAGPDDEEDGNDFDWDGNGDGGSTSEGEEDDEAGKWLASKTGGADKTPPPPADKDKGGAGDSPQEPKKRKLGGHEWAPREDYSPKEQEAIKGFLEQGYSHREAERMANAYKGPSDLHSALGHSMRPSQPSEKMLGELKELAGHWLKNVDKQARLKAEPEKNPVKFAAGKLGQAHEDKTKDYAEAWHEFIANPGLKHLTPRERHSVAREWKQNWKKGNQGYSKGLDSVSGEQRHFSEAADVRSKALQEKIEHILSGGASGGDMDAYEAAQHLGMSASEEDAGPNISTFKDPSADFANKNADFIEMHNQKKAAAQAQPITPAPTPEIPAVPAAPKPGFTIRKKASPEQLERFNRVTAAKLAMGNKKPDDGGEKE